MRLIECVVRKIIDVLIDRLRRLRRDAARHAAGDAALRIAVDKCLSLGFDLLRLFLGNGAAHQIRLSERIAGESAEDLNDLLLIDDAAVGDAEDRLERGMQVGHELRVVLAGNEARDGIHGTRTVERDDRGQILDALGLHTRTHARHAAGFQLEYAARPARLQHGVGIRVIVRYRRKCKGLFLFLYQLHRVVQNGEVPKTEKVHLQKSQLLERDHRILADDGVIIARKRHIIHHGVFRNDDAGSVCGGVTRHALERARRVDELFDLFLALVPLAQLTRELHRLVKRDMQSVWNELCDHVAVRIAHIERAADVANDAARRHGAERDDLRHMILAVLAAHIFNDLAAARIAEVHVDIGHGNALRVQKPLKIQRIRDRIDVGNVQTVGHHAARGAAAPGTDRDANASGIAHKIGNDEKIVGKAHFLDHILLVGQLPAQCLAPLAVALTVALVAELLEVGKAVIALGKLEFRQVILAEGEFDIAHFGDLSGVFNRLGILGKERRHFLRRAEVEVLRLVTHAVLVIHRFPGLNTQQNVVRVGVLLAQVVRVVRHNERQTRLLVQAQNALVDDRLLADAVILQLQVEMVRTEDLSERQRVFLRALIAAAAEPARDLAGKAGRQGDQPFAVLAQQRKVDARLNVKALDMRHGNEVGKVAVPLLVLAQQHQMARLAVKFVLLIKARARRNIDLAADDRLDALSFAGAVKVDRAVHHAVVRDGAGGLPHLLDKLRKVFDAAGSVEQAVFRMNMKVGKGHGVPPHRTVKARFIFLLP